jgi:hypothetical protein
MVMSSGGKQNQFTKARNKAMYDKWNVRMCGLAKDQKRISEERKACVGSVLQSNVVDGHAAE